MNLIEEYEGGLGSSLNRINKLEYIAYAQWSDRENWEASGDNLPPTSKCWGSTLGYKILLCLI